MINDLEVNRPAPITKKVYPIPFSQNTDIRNTIEALEDGNHVMIQDVYKSGLVLVHELKRAMKRKYPDNSAVSMREFRYEFGKLSRLILVEIDNNKLVVKKGPEIGWLEKLYPDIPYFVLPFTQVQELNTAWQAFTKGVAIPVLRSKLFPYYGTHVPSQFEHLILFDNWLKRYDGPKKSAINVGVSNGITAMQLVLHRFQMVFGTDVNPNALVGFTEFMGTTKLSRKVNLDHGNLFGKWIKPTELIVFNPPWLPNTRGFDVVDPAIYYKDDLFPDFFEGAKERLLPDGKIVLLFSNLAQISNLTDTHPIEDEIENGDRFKLELMLTKKVKIDKDNRAKRPPEDEVMELWVLSHKE